MEYPIALHKDPDSSFGVTVPDLPGCFSYGDTVQEAMAMAREAILGHIEVMLEEGMDIPRPSTIEEHMATGEYDDAYAWALVSVDLSQVPGRSKRINISMQERVLDVFDAVARQEGETRSGLLQRLAGDYVASRRVKAAK